MARKNANPRPSGDVLLVSLVGVRASDRTVLVAAVCGTAGLAAPTNNINNRQADAHVDAGGDAATAGSHLEDY